MQFYSFTFVLLFLPLTVFLYYKLRRAERNAAAVVLLVVASAVFYAWWDAAFLWVIGGSIVANYAFSIAIAYANARDGRKLAAGLFLVGLFGNLGVLGWYKYACLLGPTGACSTVILPLAISFFTFQQIEFLWDHLNGKVEFQRFADYCLFVLFFPHLLAGPITRHSEMMPQFLANDRDVRSNIAIGLALFALGLAKKVLVADTIAVYSNPVFDAAGAGRDVSLVPAWIGAVGFTLQLYFDFSGYSDMAIGISRIFGIRLPLNFNSPMKAVNISQFWQCWHITLTRYINAYLYNPLALMFTRKCQEIGASGRLSAAAAIGVATLVTMTLAGIWHGAGAQYVVFGLLHGVYLAGYRIWKALARESALVGRIDERLPVPLCRLTTFLLVVVAFVFFKSESVDAAIALLKAMVDLDQLRIPQAYLDERLGRIGEILLAIGVKPIAKLEGSLFFGINSVLAVLGALAVAWYCPNSQQIIGAVMNGPDTARKSKSPVTYSIARLPTLWHWIAWRPGVLSGLICGALIVASLTKANYRPIEFLYFQF